MKKSKTTAAKPKYRAYKYRLYPTVEQQEFLSQHFGCSRFVYNYFLAHEQNTYKEQQEKLQEEFLISGCMANELPEFKGKFSFYHNNAELLTKLKKEEEYIWLKDVNSQILQQSLMHLDKALKDSFNPKLKSKFPTFKKRNSDQSFTLPQNYMPGKEVVFDLTGEKHNTDISILKVTCAIKKPVLRITINPEKNNSRKNVYSSLHLPKFKEAIPIIIHNKNKQEKYKDINQLTQIKSITISKNKAQEYYASILVEEPNISIISKQKYDIGIDLGLKDLLTAAKQSKETKEIETVVLSNLSKGKRYGKINQRIIRLQKVMAKLVRGSANFVEVKTKIAKFYQRRTNLLNDYYHQLTTALVKENQLIVVEGLKVVNMLKNRKLSKAIHEVAWGKLLAMLKYKAAWWGSEVIVLDTFFPSSQLCSSCNYQYKELKLSEREWICPSCGVKHQRDENAAKNILFRGLGKVWLGTSRQNPSLASCKASDCSTGAVRSPVI